MKNFTSINDIKNTNSLIQQALDLKQNPHQYSVIGQHKTLGLIFFNPSLRTRLSTQKAAQLLGMNVMVMNVNKDGWQIELEDGAIMDLGTQEHIKDAAGVLSQYCDIIGVRTFAEMTDRQEDENEKILKQFMNYASVPVISLESATLHPLQSLADAMTINSHLKVDKPKVVLSWAPHPKALPQAVANSFVQWINTLDVNLVVTHPEGYELNSNIAGNHTVCYNQEEALKDADFVYVKNWSNYQFNGKLDTSLNQWTMTTDKMKLTNDAHFMHCLPIRRNVVASDAVIDASNSLILEQAENRTYAAQAVLLNLLNYGEN